MQDSLIIFTVSRDGTHLFSSHDSDLHPEVLSERAAGEYSTRVALPRACFPGNYQVSLSAAIGPLGAQHHEGHYDVLNFEVNDEGLDPFLSYTRSRGTMVITELEWKTWKTGNAA